MEIKIIHVVLGKANPDRMNGVNKVVNSLATFQSQLGYDVTVWGITKSLEVNFPKRNYSTELFKDVSKFRLDKKINNRLLELETKTVFHIHGAFIPQFYSLAKKLVKHRFEYLYTPHGAYNSVALERSAVKKKIYISLFESFVAKNAKRLHFIGQSEKNGARTLYNEFDYALVPNGQNIEELKFSYKSIPREVDAIFGFVGRLDIKTKGLDILLKGFAKHQNSSHKSNELWIIGDGDQRSTLESMARELKIESKVKFFGSKFGSEKLNLMANMDYLCLTSRNEGLPGVVLEAAALGIPSIVSKETNMATYINENNSGFYLEKNNPKCLATTFEIAADYIKSGKLKLFKDNAIAMIKSQFNWINISKRLISEYEA